MRLEDDVVSMYMILLVESDVTYIIVLAALTVWWARPTKPLLEHLGESKLE